MKSNIVKLPVTVCLLAASATLISPAKADDDAYCGNIPRAEWKSVSEVSSAVEAMGYEVREIERDDGCFEVEARDQSGQRFELYLNPHTLQIVKKERDS